MENSTDSYLHKKFKKQLSVEPKLIQNESKSGVVESREEKKSENQSSQPRKDNNECVPNQSTNQNSSLSSRNFSKSSISVEECRANLQSSNSCISLDKSWSSEQSKPSFDTNHEPVSTSSILDNLYNKQYVKPEDASSNIAKDHDEEKSEPQPVPDKSTAGKYVCTYCNLVCSKPSVLQKHIRAHTNERPYPCNSCGFSFKTRSNLYKHCRSRTHANRVMGNKVQELNNEVPEVPEPKSPQSNDALNEDREKIVDLKTKPYKPRFHSKQLFKENEENKEEPKHNSNLLSEHINDIISKNNSIVNSNDSYLLKKRSEVFADNNEQRHITDLLCLNNVDEPLNLTKNRKRCMSELVEPVAQKSLIKELLLKNLNSDMQCPHCKMIFQTVTELELHKLRSCKGFIKPGAKYTRSSSVNVASILTQNKNAFDGIPHMQNTFAMKSPGPFLGKTRLVESDKTKSFSFDDGLPTAFPSVTPSDRYLLSPLTLPSERDKKPPVRLFGGEVKITHNTGETKSFKIDNSDDKFDGSMVEYSGKVSENRVVKSGLQSGGTILTNKANYPKDDGLRGGQDVIRVYENSPVSPSIDMSNLGKPQLNFNRQGDIYRNDIVVRSQMDQISVSSSSYKYTNIMDFSQKAVKLLTPNLRQPNLAVPGVPAPNKFTFPTINEEKVIDLEKLKEPEPQNLTTQKVFQPKVLTSQSNLYNPMKLLVNGKVVRYVPGIPGPVAAEEPVDMAYASPIISTKPLIRPPPKPDSKIPPPKSPKIETLEVKTDFAFKVTEMKSPKPREKSPVKIIDKPIPLSEAKKFARPNSLALKPTTASLKQHHGLTPTMFNQILISPDTPRVAKKYVQQFLHGNYFSYLGLKSSTKPVYCTLNKTQPFYVPHFKKLSMYSEWRQQDTKTEKIFVSGYDSRQKHGKYTMAGKTTADLVVHSSYKFVISESASSGEKSEEQHKSNTVLGGYECNEDYTYVRGRGRYVCDQCGIRCKKPSMLKKHIRTHSNDRPYTCNHCNFSFKTKGNLTKHMKSKAHTKNYAASGSGSSTQQSGTQSSESDTEDSGMDSSDESTRREEHEAAYGLLSLAQKTSHNIRGESNSPIPAGGVDASPHNVLNTEEIVHVSKSNYVKNKILDDKPPINFSAPTLNLHSSTSSDGDEETKNVLQFLGKTTINRPLTYPYTSVLSPENHEIKEGEKEKSIKQFHVIQKYANHPQSPNKVRESPKNDCGANWFQEKVTGGRSVSKDRTKVVVQNEVHVKVNNVQPPVLKVNDSVVLTDTNVTDLRKRKLSYSDSEYDRGKRQKTDEVMDLSMPTEKGQEVRYNGSPVPREEERYHVIKKNEDIYEKSPAKNNGYLVLPPNDVNINYVIQESQPANGDSPKSYKSVEYDNSAMETLADIATKQVKLEKNTLAKSVASEFLKIATKNESGDVSRVNQQEVNDLIVRPEGNKSCHICAKSFSKAPQLRLHMNIHYLERPFRCHSCSVSFRTKGHLQKHERSASHHNKLSSSPALSSSEPRPFKCVDCNIAFRIHGHLAKHLRSKMHIMKLECLAKIPFGLYAELERSNSLLTEINTADGDQCLESLKTLAKKVFINDPNKLNQLSSEPVDTDS